MCNTFKRLMILIGPAAYLLTATGKTFLTNYTSTVAQSDFFDLYKKDFLLISGVLALCSDLGIGNIWLGGTKYRH
jgi:hypothetical protein